MCVCFNCHSLSVCVRVCVCEREREKGRTSAKHLAESVILNPFSGEAQNSAKSHVWIISGASSIKVPEQ